MRIISIFKFDSHLDFGHHTKNTLMIYRKIVLDHREFIYMQARKYFSKFQSRP